MRQNAVLRGNRFLCIVYKCFQRVYVSDVLAPLAEGQQAIVMAFCPSCVRPSVCTCICKLFL